MLKTNKKISPFKTILMLYVACIFLFSTLLYLPFSNNGTLSYIDALFVSTSALSVTGLTPVDVSEVFTTTGQALLMLEFQIGGIGVLALFTYILFFLGRDFSLSQLLLISADQNQIGIKSIRKIMLTILLVTVIIESLGIAATYPAIADKYGHNWNSLFMSSFHSVSSFTNAGFDLFGDSLVGFQNDPMFLLATSFLIILGVLGFPLVMDVLNIKKKKKTLYTKVNLLVHGSLLVFGFIIFFVAEWSNTLKDLTVANKAINAFFLSSTARNGGLSSIDINTLGTGALVVLMFLMFVGGSSSSTGGGIRTSTFAVLVTKLWSIGIGREETVLFKKTIPTPTVEKSFLIFFTFLLFFFTSLATISFIEPFSLKEISFEVLSALTTTGLSTGITGELTTFSKLLLSLLMLIGRIGIMSWIYLFIKESKSKTKYIKEDIIVG